MYSLDSLKETHVALFAMLRWNQHLIYSLIVLYLNVLVWLELGVDAQNFLVYHVPLCKWAERGLSCLEGMLSPKLYTRLVDLPDG
jgi:hypothetical protein